MACCLGAEAEEAEEGSAPKVEMTLAWTSPKETDHGGSVEEREGGYCYDGEPPVPFHTSVT